MRTFDQLSDLEKGDAISHCNYEILELLYTGLVISQDEDIAEKILKATEESENLPHFYCHTLVVDDINVSVYIDELAEALAVDAEYPSLNEDGTYKKIIQL